MIRSILYALAVTCLAAQTACISADTEPAPDRPRRDSVARNLYEVHCASCHGRDLSGGRAPTLFNTVLLNEKTDESLRLTITGGIADAGMPPFSSVLDDSEIWLLLAFLRNEAEEFADRPEFIPSPDGQIVESDKQSFRIDVLATGLDVPWGMAFLPDGRALVTERSGNVRILSDDTLLPDPVRNTPQVQVGQDAGLFDVAIHPDYAVNGWIYLSYAETLPGFVPPANPPEVAPGTRPPRPPSMTVIVRGRLGEANEWVDSEVLFRAPAELYTSNGAHYGSRFVFDDEGYLYYSIGERGDMAHAQDLTSPLGKIHRVFDDGTVPPDNPFVDIDGAVRSIWSYGHRNPQGLAFDPVTGLLWASEHGPSGGDEINIIEPGRNYGWGVITMGLERGITQQSAPGMEQPVVYYNPTLAPSGISFYRGERYPGWQHSLFVAGLAGQQLRRLEIDGRQVVEQEVLFDSYGRTRAVVEGPDGLLYALLQNPTGSGTGLRLSDPSPGIVVRLVPVGQAAAETPRQ